MGGLGTDIRNVNMGDIFRGGEGRGRGMGI